MKHSDLRSFISFLEQQGELVRIIADPVRNDRDQRPHARQGPLLPKAIQCQFCVTPHAKTRGMGMGQESVAALRDVGELLAFLKQLEPPKDLRDLGIRHDLNKCLICQLKPLKKPPAKK